jgi:hypothetical protein
MPLMLAAALLFVAVFGAARAAAAPPDVGGLRSPSHPDQTKWYKNAKPSFAWSQVTGIVGYSYLLDRAMASDPGTAWSDVGLPSPSFVVKNNIIASTAAGAQGWGAAIGDLNGDGRLDIATANWGSGSVSVLLGDGKGGFARHDERSFGAHAHSVAIGDVNGDGFPDVVASDRDTSKVRVFRGKIDGSGKLQNGISFDTGSKPKQLAAVDLNGDGFADVVTTDSADNTVSVLLGSAAGLSAPRAFPAGAQPEAVEIADLNGDGRLDVAVANWTGDSVHILLGDGSGGFRAAGQHGVGRDPHDLCAGDFNGDGVVDLATANWSDNSISILLGAGNGTFSVQTIKGVASVPSGVVAADYDRDGSCDIVVSDWGRNRVAVLRGKGNGDFETASATTYGVGSQPLALAGDDLNKDEAPDVIVAQTGPAGNSTLAVLLNRSTTPRVTLTSAPQGVSYFHIRAVDADFVGGLTSHLAVRIDTKRPSTRAPYKASVRRNGYAVLRYRIDEYRPGSPTDVTIRIKTRSGKTVRTVALKNRSANTWLQYRFRCTLAKGTYYFHVSAKDRAGNTQTKVASNTLRVY